jgi:hypothetical protein
MTFAAQVMNFYEKIECPSVPHDIELLWPVQKEEVRILMNEFYRKFYDDNYKRTILFGINPGRFGAGVTGIGFTDPIRLDGECKIKNVLPRHQELSSVFIYEVISQWGGPLEFFSKFWFSALSPVGYKHQGKNINYYDRPDLLKATKKFIVECIQQQLELQVNRNVAFVVGQGKNLEILKNLNSDYHFFEHIEALPHPRWVMQYKLKEKQFFIDQYIRQLSSVL